MSQPENRQLLSEWEFFQKYSANVAFSWHEDKDGAINKQDIWRSIANETT